MCQLNGEVSSDNMKIDTCLTEIREVHARWINELFVYLKGRPDDIGKALKSWVQLMLVDQTLQWMIIHLQILFLFRSLAIRTSSHL